eukprot:7664183-Lingulodinium_polyedra.AAC.1
MRVQGPPQGRTHASRQPVLRPGAAAARATDPCLSSPAATRASRSVRRESEDAAPVRASLLALGRRQVSVARRRPLQGRSACGAQERPGDSSEASCPPEENRRHHRGHHSHRGRRQLGRRRHRHRHCHHCQCHRHCRHHSRVVNVYFITIVRAIA